MQLPNLLIIGAMKAGSTSLHNYLNLHHDIQMSTPKELNFFSSEENFKKGVPWYKSFFKTGFKYNGESSINYTKRHIFPDVPERIQKTLGNDVKLIYIVRDPVKRFQSNFTDSKTYGDVPSSYSINQFIEEGLEKNPLIKTSLYFFQIEAYLKLFKLKNILFLTADELRNEPQITMNKVFCFLNLPSIPVENILLNQSVNKKYYSSRFLLFNKIPIVKRVKKIIPTGIKNLIKKQGIIEKISKDSFDPSLDVINESNESLLYGFFKGDLDKFKALSGIKF